MKLTRFLARRGSSGFRLLSMRGVVGARERILTRFFGEPFGPYRGPYEDHVIILVQEGTIVFEKNETRYEATEGEALLIRRGDGGRLYFTPCPVKHGLVAHVFAFDERAIARVLRNCPDWESRAVTETRAAPDAFALHKFHRYHLQTPEPIPEDSDRFGFAIRELLQHSRPGLAAFLRDSFYRSRSALCAFMEQFVLSPDGAQKAAAQYSGGPLRLSRDCRLYLGVRRPEQIITRRRMELASAWLRCGHAIDSVAQALNYASRFEFQSAFSGFTKMGCADVQRSKPLPEVEVEELIEALTPFWWKGRRKLAFEAPPRPERSFSVSSMSAAKEEELIRAHPELKRKKEAEKEQRTKITKELREKAVDFFNMKCTGAKLIVPTFEFEKPMDEAA